jgi:hypothetical protein
MKIETFIFVHDQQIILDFLEHKKYSTLPNVKYVFLGDREIDKIINLNNVIIAKNQPYNMEDFPKLTSYTGWYCLWKNGLIDGDYLNLFEYDTNCSENLVSEIQKTISEENVDVIGYIPFSIHNYNYIGHIPWCEKLKESLKKEYDIDVTDFIKNQPESTICSMTSNHTMSKKSFEHYMDWIDKMILNIRKSSLSGHEVERSISLFYLLNNITYKILPNILTHYQFDSHRTQGISQNKLITHYQELLTQNDL